MASVVALEPCLEYVKLYKIHYLAAVMAIDVSDAVRNDDAYDENYELDEQLAKMAAVADDECVDELDENSMDDR